jgi:16S rRNA (uracil1498-N3)-methyltransferase
MRLHRFYINQNIGETKELIISDLELIHQMVNVFRFKVGQEAILFDGSGFEYVSEIVLISKNEITVKIKSVSEKKIQTKKVDLYLSIIKKDNFELAAEKGTEVGVSEIHPLISERSEKKDLNIERLEKIVKEASEQSGRVTLPKVLPVTDFDIAVSQAVKDGKECVVFHMVTDSKIEAGHNRPGHQNDHPALTKVGIDGRHQVAAFVGPEGGWTEKEMKVFKKNNFKIFSLGQNVLRAETAAIVSVWKLLQD